MEQWQLKQMQSLPLEAKIQKSLLRIREWYEHFDGNVYVSFSGGKDSTVLLHLVRSLYPDAEALFCNTGLEYPEIIQFVREMPNVTWLRPKMSFRQVIDKYGYPVISKEQSQYIDEVRNAKTQGKLYNTRLNGNEWGRGKISDKWKFLINAPFKVSHKCCSVMKKEPIKRYEKETGKKGFIGIMAGESSLRTQKYLRSGCNAFDDKRPLSQPISFWTESDIWEYIKMFDVKYSSIYDMGYKRTGCVFCAFGAQFSDDDRFKRMKKTHPQLHSYCMKPWEDGGLGMQKVLDYIGVETKDPFEGQFNIFDLLVV